MRHGGQTRRSFLAGSAGAVVAAGSAGAARAGAAGGDYAFEVTRSEAEWRARLTEAEYKILRENDTELPNTSPLVNETRVGVFCCKGCDLAIYDSIWKVPLDIGWVFFSHSRPRSVLTSIDGDPPDGMGDATAPEAMIEVHCRRCASHLGHVVIAREKLVHCINGTSLNFRAGDV